MKQRRNKSYVVKALLKFGSKENIIDLFENGTIYINPIQYFRAVEDAELRGDKYEGVIEVINLPKGDLEIPILNFKGKYESIHLRKVHKNIIGNIYSLYCISSFNIANPLDFKMDTRIMGFGSHCLSIKDIQVFIDRIEIALKNRNYKYSHGFVSYYDRFKRNGLVTLFEKPNEFSYQNEFRFYIKSETIAPIILNIGSLKDIAEIYSTSDILALQLVSTN